ncbi:hypothetical protein NIES4071_76750 [Calothrix sp. NIES-4071]|nr:hypothetical protein NIES4071_76750 [Calothrix sp. NIES-4071]BAZ61949.1 hypothetical protein NIES4105_76690 [Calothrix sp. NIES-4105]
MNNNVKKALLLTTASLGLLSVSVATADVASAGYASGSASVTNIDGSTYSVGGEFGGPGVNYNSVTVEPTYNAVDSANISSYAVNNLVVTGSTTVNAADTMTISEQVVETLNNLAPNGAITTANLSNYVGIIRAAGGADGLE